MVQCFSQDWVLSGFSFFEYLHMELKSRNFTSKEPHVTREPLVADPLI